MTHPAKRNLDYVKEQIITVLKHPEAQDGLFFRNFANLHEEDERPAVNADEVDILDALKQLIEEGRVRVQDETQEMIFHLVR